MKSGRIKQSVNRFDLSSRQLRKIRVPKKFFEINDMLKQLFNYREIGMFDFSFIDYLIYELYFSEKFKEDGMPTPLAELVEPYLFDIDKIKSEKEKLKKIEKFVERIKKDKKIQKEIEKIKTHPWVKIIEEETKS